MLRTGRQGGVYQSREKLRRRRHVYVEAGREDERGDDQIQRRGHVLRRDRPDEAAAAALERVRVGARERSAAGSVQHLCGNQPVRRVHPIILH